MPFTEKLPEWFAAGTEPTTIQKTAGYTPGLKPPAQWFNWHLHTSYLAMKELQGNAVHKEVIESRLNTINTKTVTLEPGVQIIQAAKPAPISLTALTGRTLVNLLGRYGGCETLGPWAANLALVSDTTKRTSGVSSFTLTLGSATATAVITFNTRPGLRYVLAADVEVPDGASATLEMVGNANVVTTTARSGFQPLVHGAVATAFFHELKLSFTGPRGAVCWMDSVRVYEVSETEYAALATMGQEAQAAKYPYVDSVTPVRNPYAIRYGENLAPPFYEWTHSSPSYAVNGPYSLTMDITASSVSSVSFVELSVSPNTDYTYRAEHNGYLSVTAPNGAVLVDHTTSPMVTFNSGNRNKLTIHVYNNRLTGVFTFTNPMLNIGSQALPFVPREDAMLALQTDLYADPMTGANADSVFERDGQYFKAKRWERVVLDGSLPWLYANSKTGYKSIAWNDVVGAPVSNTGFVIKNDGKILGRWLANSESTGADQHVLDGATSDLWMTISNTDSGWGDSYTPTADEIKAYFLGWVMFDGTAGGATPDHPANNLYNGTGTKYWARRADGVSRSSWQDATATLPTTQAPNWTPYELVYQLDSPQ